MITDVQQLTREIETEARLLEQIRSEIGKLIVGQTKLVERLLTALLCNSHVLIEGVPGLAKTLTVTTLAQAIAASFQRIQFTPDLLPADLIGTLIYNPKTGEFTTRKGPIFANIILADEINRAPAKVQSALLEAMQERQVTIGDAHLPAGRALPGAGHPEPHRAGRHLPPARGPGRPLHAQAQGHLSHQERGAADSAAHGRAPAELPQVTPVISPEDIRRLRPLADADLHGREDRGIYRQPRGRHAAIPRPTSCDIRHLIQYGASPRATIFLAMAAKAHALLAGPRLRDPAGRQDHGHGRAAAPGHRHLRGRGGREDQRGCDPADSSTRSRCHDQQELAEKIRTIQIYTSKAVNDVLAGEYESVFKGRGMEFDEVREYQPGDDIRTIDWNVTARTGHPYVKQFVEERELTVFFLVDLSASGAFGSGQRLKNEVAAELCALLAFSAIKNNDKVGLIAFTDTVELFIPPKKGTTHVLRLIREILSFSPERGGTNIAASLHFFGRITHKRSVAFLVSDFIDQDFFSPMRIIARRHDLIAVSITDPRETGAARGRAH